MTETELQGLLANLRRASAARGSAVRVQLGPAAPQSAVSHCAELINTNFPQSLAAFLATWNGIVVDYFDDSTSETQGSEISSVRFEILSAQLVFKATANLRAFLGLAARDAIERRLIERLISGILVISQENDFVQYMAVDRCDNSGICPIMALDLQYYEDWLENQGEPIASSLDDHIRNSLEHMAQTGKHFFYWL